MTGAAEVSRVLVWFENNRRGQAALSGAHNLALSLSADLTVIAVAPHERVIGCGRCLQGTVLWNIEMEKIAREELDEARRVLGAVAHVTYELAVGDPAEVITEAARRLDVQIVVMPLQRKRWLDPPNRRNVDEKVAASGPWKVLAAAGSVAA